MYPSDWAWMAWLAGGAATFTVLQRRARAAYPDYQHTLSATTRRWLGVFPQRGRRLPLSVGLAGLFGLLAAHFVSEPPLCHRFPDAVPYYMVTPPKGLPWKQVDTGPA